MTAHAGPVYEVTLSIDREAAHDIDDWLAGHVEAMLAVPGIVAARSYALDDDGDRLRRVTCYQIESEAHLEQYLAGPDETFRQATLDRFGEHVEASRRVLRDPASAEEDRERIEHCLNCDAVLTGQYCGACGQRARSRLISVWELVRDAFGDLFELDSRLWRTLIPLSTRPGVLTRDYLRGKRARYMPPFRMYLVMSLAFFVIAFFDPRDDLGILFAAPEPTPAEESTAPDAADAADAALGELRRELASEGVFDDEPDEDEDGLTITINGDEESVDDCVFEDYDPARMPPWLARRMTRERVEAACRRVFKEDQGLKGFADRMVENVPIGLFILLPLMAFVLKVLYPLSKRYYVEHLLFVVHYHAFIFLALTTQILLTRTFNLIRLPEAVDDLTVLVISLYIPVYLYKSLRRVYEQGRFSTLIKFLLLLVAYMAGLGLIILLAALFAAFSA